MTDPPFVQLIVRVHEAENTLSYEKRGESVREGRRFCGGNEKVGRQRFSLTPHSFKINNGTFCNKLKELLLIGSAYLEL